MDWGFKKIPFTLYTYVLAKILQNGAKFRYAKAGFKNYRNLNNFRQAVESPKSWNLMGFCPKKYIPSAKTYTVDLSNITFNYLCVDSPSYLCHFWNHKSFFTSQILCIFLAQTLCHFSNKKWVFLQSLDLFSVSWEIILLHFFSWNFMCYLFATNPIKIHKTPHAIFETKS